MLFVVAACTVDPPFNQPPAPSTNEPTAAEPSAGTEPSPAVPPPLDPVTLGEGLNEVLSRALTLDALPVLEAYEAAMTWSDGSCPTISGYPYGYGWLESWYAQCDSLQGATYSGFVSDYVSDYPFSGLRGLYMGATILTPDDTTLNVSGYFAHAWNAYGPEPYTYRYLDGVVSYDGPSVGGTWIEEQIQLHEFELTLTEPLSGAWRSVSADGEFTGAAGAVDTVDFASVYVDSRYGCPEPTGAIAVRTSEGDWYDIDYAGSADPCDGCGIARWSGLAMGEICADFTLWTAP